MTTETPLDSKKPPREDISFPKRQILAARVDLSEGPSLVFLVAESKPFGLIDGKINMEASDKDSNLCPKCKTKLAVAKIHRDREGEETHADVTCPNCGTSGVVWND